MKTSLFGYRDYKKYLLDQMRTRPRAGRGFKKALSKTIGCQTAFISHVFQDRAHFSLEQGEAISRYLGLSPAETRFFLLLIDFTRAGTPELRRVLKQELDLLEEQSLVIKQRVAVKATLSREDQSVYYSAWYYAAIHVGITIPELRTAETLQFLVSVGLATEKEGRFHPGQTLIHLERDSPLISKHHSNWRMQAIRDC